MKERNVVQAEFFLADTQASSLEALQRDILGRIKDNLPLAIAGSDRGPSIKTAVRFYDMSGELTRLAVRSEALESAQQRAMDRLIDAGPFRRVFLERRYRKIARSLTKVRRSALGESVQQIRRILKTNGAIAVEGTSRRFRPLRPDEAHELAESVSNSRRAWFFVYRPNSLLADSDIMVAHLM